MKKFELVAEVITLANTERIANAADCGALSNLHDECHATKI